MTEENGLVTLKNMHRQIERERRIKIDISKTQYPLIRNVAVNQIGWTLWGRQDQKGDANLFWSDTYVTEELIKRLKPYQRINHFPNSQQLGKKNLLSENIKRMKHLFPNEYDFYPETWVLPEQNEIFLNYQKQNTEKGLKKKWLIVKPSASSQGKGIYLTKDIQAQCKEPKVVQEYIMNPLLIQECKFDLRIYVFIKSLNPLKIFRFQEGLARLSTSAYNSPTKENKTNLNMHLTNYAINKWSPFFVQNKSIEQSAIGHKRSLGAIYTQLQQQGCNSKQLKTKIDEIIVKTILAAYPKLQASYKECRDTQMESDSVCFQILGFDIIIDQKFKPWLLEVNHSPSFCTESPLDFVVKKYLILDTLILLNLNGEQKQMFLKSKPKEKDSPVKDRDMIRIKRKFQEVFEGSHLGGYEKIYHCSKYITIMNRITEKKAKSNITKKPDSKLELDTGQSEMTETKNPLPSTSIRKRHPLTLYGHFGLKNNTHSEQNPQNPRDQLQEQQLRRHLFLERDKKKYIQPIKMNNISIKFFQDAKTYYKHGFFGKRSMEKEKPNISGHNPSQSLIFEPKTSEGGRHQIKKLDHEIRTRIQKMKLARIKIHKIQSNQSKQKRMESHSHRVMADPLRFQVKELRGQNKYI